MVSFKLQAIKPPTLPTGEEYAKAMQDAVYKSAGLALKDLESTVRTWKNKPTFDLTITKTGDDYGITAGTDDPVYGYVDLGTPPHDIKPKRSKYLRFSSGFKAKTRVGVIGSQQGGSSGDDVFSKGVHHPGTKARDFSKIIAVRRQKTIVQEISQAIAKVNRTK